jgi:hypothetical protein
MSPATGLSKKGALSIFELVSVGGFRSDKFRKGSRCTISSISLDIFTERLWRSLKCEDIYLKDYLEVPE